MAPEPSKEPTPMFRQYAELKSQHKNSVLFFRMGDFYEMFQSDAIEVSRLLNLTLTQRQGTPMCGIPYHAAGNYIARLLKFGKKVAICEQIELPPSGKGLARREVVEVVTPGTVVDDAYLEERKNNYLAALAGNQNETAFAYIDLSTGEFRATILDKILIKDALRREMAKTSPHELIIQESLLESDSFSFLLDEDIVINRIPDWNLDPNSAEERLKRQFSTVNLKAFTLQDKDVRILAAAAILDYIDDNHKNILPHIRAISCYGEDDFVGLDESTIRNLEIINNLQDGGKKYTLLEILDHTRTSAGARLLRKTLLQPIPNATDIIEFHNRVDALYHNQKLLSQVRLILANLQDIERLAARSGMDRAHGKDLVAIRHSLDKASQIREILDINLWDIAHADLERIFQVAGELSAFLASSLLDNPSILLTEGSLIRDGWDSKIDQMRMIQKEGKNFLNQYIAEEKAATGISSMKLKYNRVLGYFIEMNRNQDKNLPERFRLRQTLSQVERFSTNRLEELENQIFSVGDELVEREREIFLGIREHVKETIPQLMEIARLLADIDLLQSYAHAATEYGYVRPEITQDTVIDIQGGRHPVVERYIPQGEFVPNDILLSGNGLSFTLMTGPNMAGKSTVLRQVALITLMAQAGSFVPADYAKIGTVDRIFCRVGASDNLARGESTFLVEMNETANILRNASSQSLVIMDEVGRGTGTADGLAIAQAVCEYLLNHQSPRTLFATHYRELTQIEHEKMMNLSMAVREVEDKIIFPKKIVTGPAEASYGIHVAALAGLPEMVVKRAHTLLKKAHEPIQTVPYAKEESPEYFEPLLFDPRDLVFESLKTLNCDTISPLEALQLLVQWKKDINELS